MLREHTEQDKGEIGGNTAPKGAGHAAFLDAAAAAAGGLRLLSVDLLLSHQHGANTQLCLGVAAVQLGCWS